LTVIVSTRFGALKLSPTASGTATDIDFMRMLPACESPWRGPIVTFTVSFPGGRTSENVPSDAVNTVWCGVPQPS
jgi:hypothetical protein